MCARVARNRVRLQSNPAQKDPRLSVSTFARTFIVKQSCLCESQVHRTSPLHSTFSTPSRFNIAPTPVTAPRKTVHFAPVRATLLPSTIPVGQKKKNMATRVRPQAAKRDPRVCSPMRSCIQTPRAPSIKPAIHGLRKHSNHVDFGCATTRSIPGLRRRVKQDDGRLSGLESLCSFSELF